MPNWCSNTVTLRHTDPAMIERAKAAFAQGKFLNEFIPVPESLHIIAGSVGDPDEQKLLEEATARNFEIHGYGNWYDYCVNEWGTKWDVGDDDGINDVTPNELTVFFESAWSPPLAAYEKLTAQGFEIDAMYYESGMAFAGRWTSDSGDDYYEYGGLSPEQIAEELPKEVDEAFSISEDAAMWAADNQEEENE